MTFHRYKEEAKRLNQQDGLGDWKTRPLESRSEQQDGQQCKGTLRNTQTFSQRRKATQNPVQEAPQPYPNTGKDNPAADCKEQHDTNSDRPRDDIGSSPRQDSEGSSSKPRKQPFSSLYKRKG